MKNVNLNPGGVIGGVAGVGVALLFVFLYANPEGRFGNLHHHVRVRRSHRR